MKSFKQFFKESFSITLVEQLQSLLFEEFSQKQIDTLTAKFGEDSLGLIKLFDNFRTQNRKEVKGVDIYQFKTKDDLEKFLNGIEQSKSEKEKIVKAEGAELVFENELCYVYLIKNKAASCFYGANTKWCITQKDAQHWENYADKDITFYFIIAKQPMKNNLGKVAVAKYPESQKGLLEVYDAADKNINIDFMKTFGINKEIFKEWIDPNIKFIQVGGKKIKYREEGGVKVYEKIDISGMRLTSLPAFN